MLQWTAWPGKCSYIMAPLEQLQLLHAFFTCLFQPPLLCTMAPWVGCSAADTDGTSQVFACGNRLLITNLLLRTISNQQVR